MFFQAISRWILVLAVLLLVGGCAISQDQEIALGRDARPQFEKEFGGVYPDPEVQQYVQEVGLRMARYAKRPDLPWEFRVLNSDTINAFALPGGFIYITRGLLMNLQTEAQLAGILGHESAHVANRHSVQQLERAQVLQGGAVLAGVLGGGTVADISAVVGGLVNLQYSREQEKEADLDGLEYLARAGYDPRALIQDMQILEKLSQGQRPPEFLSSHPNPENRQEYLSQTVERRFGQIIAGGKTGREEFRRQVLDRNARRAVR
jgi:predicted Zn-dependent protease